MRTKLHRDLAALNSALLTMCELADTAIVSATTALAEADLAAVENTVTLSNEVGALRASAETQALSALALQAPVGRDLRNVVTSIYVVADLVRMGQLACHIAKVARRQHPHPAGGPGRDALMQMGALAHELTLQAHQVLLNHDQAQAAALTTHDREMDLLRTKLFSCVMAPDSNTRIPDAVDAVLLGRFYERYGDHTVAVGQRIIYLCTAQAPGSESHSDSP